MRTRLNLIYWYPQDEFRGSCTQDVLLAEGAARYLVVLDPGQHVAALVPTPRVLTPVEGSPELLNFFRHIIIPHQPY